MIKNKRMLKLFTMLLLVIGASNLFAQKKYEYKSFEKDPMNTRIYTLENGLKVYMSVYKDAPRIQTYIAVRAGSKNDPHETTGLAHYFEHMMFKGSSHFGTLDYTKESVLIAKIDSLFEVYRVTKDSSRRDFLYHVIDSISYEASKFAIPNEYQKMMEMIGASGTNAYTSLEETVFEENIPSNQVDNWLKIEGDRFTTPVLRLFHTELETIYEEKNMTLTSDPRKVHDALFKGIFQKHTYGTQTTIGEAEHIKNPSMKNIREYFAKYYVPNNMAICLSGDFDPETTIALIDKYFGHLKSGNVPEFKYEEEAAITTPIVKEVLGPDAESVSIGYRLGGANSKDADLLTMFDMLLANGSAGLIDLDLNQAQKVLHAGASPEIMKDYSVETLSGKPKTGQSLDEVKDLLLAQVERIKKGDFPDWLATAVINDFKLRQMKGLESIEARANTYVETFIKGIPYEKEISKNDDFSKITKQQIIDFANKNFNNNYVLVYKKTGKDKSVKKVKKPKITKIQLNRDSKSEFVKEIEAAKVPEIEPVFVDYNKEIKKVKMKNDIEILYKENVSNKTFELSYVFEMGKDNDKKLAIAVDYLDYLGTSKFTSTQLTQEFYKLGCSKGVSASKDQVHVSLSGLAENMDKSLQLFESLLADPKADKDALDNFVNDIIKSRQDAKKSPRAIFSKLVNYGLYGTKSSSKNMLSETELKALTPEELVAKVKELNSFKHRVLYYGPNTTEQVIALLNKQHNTPAKLKAVPEKVKFEELATPQNKVYFVQYDQKQAKLLTLSQGMVFNKDNAPVISAFNGYFGGSMNSIVSQELREARSLAYTTYGGYDKISLEKDSHYYFQTYIETQSDKLNDALVAFNEIIEKMPEAEQTFDVAKNAIIQGIRTERVTKSAVLWSYLSDEKQGLLNTNMNKEMFEKLPAMKLSDIKKFETENVKGKTRTFLVMGNKQDIDMKTLDSYGKVVDLSFDELFGY